MAIKNIDLLFARASAFQKTLVRIDHQTKKTNVSTQLAINFNTLLDEIKKEIPADAASHLPQAVGSATSLHQRAGLVSINYVDLEILIDQVLGILEVLKTQK
jgi:hypothetical protein